MAITFAFGTLTVRPSLGYRIESPRSAYDCNLDLRAGLEAQPGRGVGGRYPEREHNDREEDRKNRGTRTTQEALLPPGPASTRPRPGRQCRQWLCAARRTPPNPSSRAQQCGVRHETGRSAKEWGLKWWATRPSARCGLATTRRATTRLLGLPCPSPGRRSEQEERGC